jgi:hypothetical protein
LNDGRIQNPSNPFGIVPLSNFAPRGFGFVHHSIAILYQKGADPHLLSTGKRVRLCVSMTAAASLTIWSVRATSNGDALVASFITSLTEPLRNCLRWFPGTPDTRQHIIHRLREQASAAPSRLTTHTFRFLTLTTVSTSRMLMGGSAPSHID